MLFIYKIFDRSIKWNVFESIFYQSVLTVHQFILFYFCDRSIYGINGILFAFLYLSIILLNFGFDKSMAAFLIYFTETKLGFKKLFLSQFIIQLIILLIITFCLIIFNVQISNFFCKFFNCNQIGPTIWILLGLLLFFEGSKKTLKMVAQLEFLNKESAFIEIAGIIFYCATFWISFFYKHTINLELIFVPLLLESIISNVVYLYLLIKIYKKIPHTTSGLSQHNNILNRILITRSSNYLNQVSHLFFSPNMLLISFGYLYGYKQSAIIKLSSSISVYFTTIISKSFGFTSEALLGHLKEFNLNIRVQALELATKKLFTTLICLLIFFITNYKLLYKLLPQITWPETYSFMFFLFFENFFITYELFFLIQEKFYYIGLLNFFSALLFYIIIFYLKISLILSISLLFLIRVVVFFIIRLISSYKLNVSLPYRVNIKYTVIFGIISVTLAFLEYILILVKFDSTI